MSSDPIEVLRSLPERWRGLANDAMRRSGTWSGSDMADRIEYMADELDTALASLSAPKPESAEAVIPWVREWQGSGPQRGFHIREATRLHNNRVVAYLGDQVDGAEVDKLIAEHNGKHPNGDPVRPAPPRPEASAPVGVEGRAREAVALALDEAGHPTEANNVRNGIDLDEYRVELSAARIALAQQPAAVDEAWQVQLADALECFWNAALGGVREHDDSTASAVMSGMVQGVAAVADRLRERAGHQQGGTPE